MITVKVSTAAPQWDWVRQTPNNDGIWNNCKFIFDKEIKKCDFWIVYGSIKQKEFVECSKKNIILISSEPPSTNQYHQKFLDQFDTIITCHKNIKHPNVILDHPSLPWFVGYQPPKREFTKSYSELSSIKNYEKTKLISIVCSEKTFTKGHKQRFEFVQKLKNHFGDYIDFFGKPFKSVQDKWHAIYPYKYHIVIENCSIPYYWTEKIADPFLAQSYPFYCGCKNIEDYFPNESFTKIDISNPKKAFEIIKETIENKTYEKSIEHLKRSKDLVLNKHNFFPKMAEFIQQRQTLRYPSYAKATEGRLLLEQLSLSNEALCEVGGERFLRKKEQITLYPGDFFYKSDPIHKKVVRKTKYFVFGRW